MRAAVFLDRDGVINKPVIRQGRPFSPRSLTEWEILPDVPEALNNLALAGYRLIVVTNQPDIARGLVSEQWIENLHAGLKAQLPLDEIYTCCHQDEDKCSCRKPEPGLLLKAAAKFDIDLTKSFMVGDRWRDIEAGKQAGCKTFFINYNYAEKQPESYDFCVFSLWEASQIILKQV